MEAKDRIATAATSSGNTNVYAVFGITYVAMSASEYGGTTAPEQTSLTIDKDRLDDVFAQDVFTPTFDRDNIVSTTDEFETVLGVPVAEKGDDRSGNSRNTANSEVEASSTVTETNTSEAEPDASYIAESDSAEASTVGGGVENESNTEAETESTIPDQSDKTKQEYSARRRLHSYFSDSSEGIETDEETKENISQRASSGETNHTDTDHDDKDSDGDNTEANDDHSGSWFDHFREYLR